MTDAPRILLVSLTNDVGGDRIVSALGRQGAACAVLGPPGNFPGLSRFVVRRFDIPASLGTWAAMRLFGGRLARAVRDWQPARIVPLDELASLLLRTVARQRHTDPRLRATLVASLGDPAGYHAACHRLPLMRLAAEVGVRTPAFGSAADPVCMPVVVKRDHSSGSGGVTIAGSPRALAAALRVAEALRVAKRLMAWAAGFDHGPDAILLQRFVPGTLAMRTVVADRGRVIDGMSLLAAQSHPKRRASTILEPLDCPEMEAAAVRIVAALGCSGFVSFDFIRDPYGAAFLIEMNPRPIGSTHLGQLFGHDLAHAFLTGAAAYAAPGPMPSSVALFPKELERDPTGAALDAHPGRRHDVPRDEPHVLAAYATFLQELHPAHAADIRARLGAGQVADTGLPLSGSLSASPIPDSSGRHALLAERAPVLLEHRPHAA